MFRRPSIRSTVTTLAAAAVLVGGADLASYAATGHPLVLGQSNSAVGTTSLKNLGRGPALSLNAAKSSPPLVVNSSKMVKHLNAQKVGGLTAAQLNPKVLRWRVGQTGTIISSNTAGSTETMLFKAKVPKGTYRVDLSAVFFHDSGDTSDGYTCLAIDNNALANPGTNLGGIWALDAGTWGDSDSGLLHFTNDSVTLSAKSTTMLFGCLFNTGIASQMRFAQPPTVTFSRIVTQDLPKKPTSLPKAARSLARLAR